MNKEESRPEEYLKGLTDEIDNFENIAKQIKPSPGDVPSVKGVDIYGETIPYKGLIGGDHIIYVDFNERYDIGLLIEEAKANDRLDLAVILERNRHIAGILLADVSGHRITDALLAGMLHQSFLLGVTYELQFRGMITNELFEKINIRFYNSSSVNKFITMIYGEISEAGTFRFISAGHPIPMVFSNEYNKLVDVSKGRLVTYPPIGTMPSKVKFDIEKHDAIIGYKERYTINEINLMGQGDILILYTDGLSEHENTDEELYAKTRLEYLLSENKHESQKNFSRL